MPDHHHPLVELTLSRFREFLREPEALFWVFAFPVLLAFALGIAFGSQQQAEALVGVLEEPGADRVAAVLEQDPLVRVRRLPRADASRELRQGAIHLLVVPGDPLTYEYDPSRPESRIARFVVDEAIQAAAGRPRPARTADREIVVPGSRYIDWVVPGLLGMNIMGTGMWSVGFSVVQARVRKILKRLMATPMRRSQYLFSQMAARLMFLVLEVGALLGFATLVFGVPVLGSWLLLGVFCLLGALCFSALGLLVASRTQTIEGVSGLMNFVMVPMWVLSGVFFASENFPDAIQPFIDVLPLTALNQALRGVMLEGAGPAALWPQAAVLAIWTSGSVAVALRIFRWR
jgi:ABC-2 type transport system permease protein